MKKSSALQFALAAVLLWSTAAFAQPAKPSSKLWPGISEIAPEVLVVYGKGAPEAEQKAAGEIAAALRAAGGAQDNLMDDEAAFADLDRAAKSHLILVGTYSSNELLKQQWGHWAIDRKAFFGGRAAPDESAQPPFYAKADGSDDGTPKSGFYVNSFGTFFKPATGYIESGRNDLYMVPSALMEKPAKLPLKICIKITGVSTPGVVRAATIFLRSGLLNGVLPASDETLPESGDAFLLSKNRYQQSLPSWVPREKLLGWILPDAGEYAGLLESSGQAPVQMWRAKYLPDNGFARFEESPHRRASDNEILVAQMASADTATKAATALVAMLSDEKVLYQNKMTFESTAVAGATAWKNKNGFHIAASGAYLLMETFAEPRGAQMLEKVVKALPQ